MLEHVSSPAITYKHKFVYYWDLMVIQYSNASNISDNLTFLKENQYTGYYSPDL